MRLEYVVPNQDQNNPHLKFHALELYAIVYKVGQMLFHSARNDNSYSLGDDDLDRKNDNQTLAINIKKPADWLQVIGRLKHSNINKKIGKCKIKIGNDGKNTSIANGSGFVSFPDLSDDTEIDGSYESINKGIQHYRDLYDVEDADNFTGFVKSRSSGKPWALHNFGAWEKKCRNYVDALLVLTIGVEGSRCPELAFFYKLLLDLIDMNRSYGTKHKPFCWENIFVSGHNYNWDNPSPQDPIKKASYGGKYPGSVMSTGTGNFKDFSNEIASLYNLLFPKNPNNFNQENVDEKLKEIETSILNEPQKYAHARRGCSLIVHWLESLQYQNETNILSIFNGVNNRQTALKKMSQIIISRYLSYFGLKKAINGDDNVENRAIRDDVLTEFSFEKDELFCFSVERKLERIFPKYSRQAPHPTRYIQVVYNQEVNENPSIPLFGLYWHTTVNCKLLPEHAFGYERTTKKGDDEIKQVGVSLIRGFVGKTQQEIDLSIWKENTCPHCFRKPANNMAPLPGQGYMKITN